MFDGQPLLRALRIASLLLLPIALWGCGSDTKKVSGSLPGGLGNDMAILSCSLGCSAGTQGVPISCGKATVKANEEISIEFTQPVDLSTVTKSSFRIKDALTGLSPQGVYLLDPSNSRRLIFRPRISFDQTGSAEFGFKLGNSYSIRLNGEDKGTGPYVKSTSGRANISTLNCIVSVIPGIVDSSPGPSDLSILVDQVTGYGVGGEVLGTVEALASGPTLLEDVFASSTIRMNFTDIISPVTVINPGGATSPTIRIAVDPDGQIGGSEDWIELPGKFQLEADESTLSSILTFRPDTGFPSAGTGLIPRKIVVEVSSGIVDLAGSPLSNPGVYSFAPESLAFAEVSLPLGGEQFTSPTFIDATSSGAFQTNGQLTPGLGGGAGRHGGLHVNLANSPFILNTDSFEVKNFGVITEGSTLFPPSDEPPSDTVTDGVFEFTSLEIESDGQLVLEGSNAARIFVRGQALVQGQISARGGVSVDETGPNLGHVSSDLPGGAGGVGSLAAGDGGRGADRPDNTGTTLLFLQGPGNGIPNPGAVIDGASGEGLGGSAPGLGLGGGEGGVHWPNNLPTGWVEFGDLQANDFCQSDQVANPGAGGGYATNGGASDAIWPNPGLNDPLGLGLIPATAAVGGDPLTIGVTPEVMELSPELGNLRGGSGGGGGGTHIYLTRTTGPALGDCLSGLINFYASHSAAGGGGGGGALQLQAGNEVRITGLITLNGGAGGSGTDPGGITLSGQATPGGGGSGGAALIQARQVLLASLTTSVDVSGGAGGLGAGLSTGGTGGAGILRIESEFPVDPLVAAPKLAPYDPVLGSEFGGADSSNIFTAANWVADESGPGTRSGSQSCWLRPNGFFFQISYKEDDFTDPLAPVLGWDMQIFAPTDPGTSFSYRDKNDINNPFGDSPQVLFGSDLGGLAGAPVIVRFQGARIAEVPEDLCDADFVENGGSISTQSLTAWVRHPAELNTYWEAVFPGDPQEVKARRSNIIRYSILFDTASANAPAFGGVESFELLALPD
ncbi:MAG: hypothetical protein ACJAVJ_000954 [Planctomycetota bacterium]|jgi:hypothetical protein